MNSTHNENKGDSRRNSLIIKLNDINFKEPRIKSRFSNIINEKFFNKEDSSYSRKNSNINSITKNKNVYNRKSFIYDDKKNRKFV